MSTADENPPIEQPTPADQFGEPPEDGAAEAIERPEDHPLETADAADTAETGVLRNSAVMAIGNSISPL